MGGNAHVVAFPCVVKGNAQESMETLEISEAMQRIQSFPVQQVSEVQGLLRRMRVEMRTRDVCSVFKYCFLVCLLLVPSTNIYHHCQYLTYIY